MCPEVAATLGESERVMLKQKEFCRIEQRHGSDAALLADAQAVWVESLAPWDHLVTLTFRWEASIWSAKRCFRKFMAREYPRLSYFAAFEPNPGRDGHHVHSVLAGDSNLYRKGMWRALFDRYGRTEVEKVKQKQDCTSYVSKYLTKAMADIEVKLNDSHWHQLHGTGSVLKLEGS